jgi:hypothetical protein
MAPSAVKKATAAGTQAEKPPLPATKVVEVKLEEPKIEE